MKTYLATMLCFLLSLCPVGGQPSVSLEDLKKIDTEPERQEFIAQAPADEQATLRAANVHLDLLREYGDEAVLKLAKESYLAKQRGLGDLEAVFNEQADLGIRYANYVYPLYITDTRRAHQMKGRRYVNVQKRFAKRNAAVHALVANLAASPQALALDGQAKQMRVEMQPAVFDAQTAPNVIKHILDDVTRPLDALLKELKQLPARSPAEVQQEYAALQETALFGPISLEDFKKVSSREEREAIIALRDFAQAPTDEMSALHEANEHLDLSLSFGAAGLKAMKDSYLARKRGLGDLEEVFGEQWEMVSLYSSEIYSGKIPSAQTKRTQRVMGRQLKDELRSLAKRNTVVHNLVAQMAASPQALALDGQAKQIRAKMNFYQPITKHMVDDLQRQLDPLFQEMKQMPAMSPVEVQQYQKEYDEIQEEVMMSNPGL